MIAVIRIRGQVGLNQRMAETLKRLNLKTKYSCIVLENPTPEKLGMMEKVKDLVAYGELNKETYAKLIEKRASKKKNFFRLHPPRGGIDSKKPAGAGKGVLGNNKEKINQLVERML
jgi:large subunit ribosomal protein L30